MHIGVSGSVRRTAGHRVSLRLAGIVSQLLHGAVKGESSKDRCDSSLRSSPLVKSIIEIAIHMDVPTSEKIEMCERNIRWCDENKLVFLSQRLRSRLAYLLFLVSFLCSSES